MGWAKYKKSRIKRHTFEKLGCEEFWVDLLGTSSAKYGKSRTFANLDPSSEEGQTKAMGFLAKHIVDWSITDPDTDEPLTVPTEDDASPIDNLPSEFIVQMFEWANEDSGAEGLVPPKSETS